jgi:Alpha/beta-hydrolase family N-terminus
MGMRSPNAGVGGRTQQAGTLVAATLMPITFQPTLMPRSGLDQALVTGISTSLNYGFAALIQDSIEALALRAAGRTDPARVDRGAWRRASIVLDLAAVGAGLAAQRALRHRPGERLPRPGGRTAAWWLSATGLSGAVTGVLQELIGRRRDLQDSSFPVAPFAGVAMAAVNDYRRRRWEARFPGVGVDEDARTSAARSLAMSLGVTAGLTGVAAGERLFAAAVGGLLEKGLPGHERLYRPLGHLAALWVLGGGLYQLIRRVDHRIERGAEQIEEAFNQAPTRRWSAAGPGAGWPGRR